MLLLGGGTSQGITKSEIFVCLVEAAGNFPFFKPFSRFFCPKGLCVWPIKIPAKTTQESSIFWEIDNLDLWFPPRLYQVTLIAMWRICQLMVNGVVNLNCSCSPRYCLDVLRSI